METPPTVAGRVFVFQARRKKLNVEIPFQILPDGRDALDACSPDNARDINLNYQTVSAETSLNVLKTLLRVGRRHLSSAC